MPARGKVGLLARQALSGKQCCMQLGYVRKASVELLARQAKDAMRRLKLTTLKLRLTRNKNQMRLKQGRKTPSNKNDYARTTLLQTHSQTSSSSIATFVHGSFAITEGPEDSRPIR